MNGTKINGALLKDMLIMGAALLERQRSAIDRLNVFPVPDGDTGTNMNMTMQSAIKEVKAADCSSVSNVAQALSLGALKGARGNSGVILSQLFRGFSKALENADDMDAAAMNQALKMGTEAAYKAVMKPKEGTMLTVSRMISEAVEAELERGANIYSLVDTMVEQGEKALQKTPELLPVLKEAGVIDSGGKGLLCIYRGFKMTLDGEEISDDFLPELDEPTAQAEEENELEALALENVDDIRFGYCTEFFIIHLSESFSDEELNKFAEKLNSVGDSVVVAHDTGIVKVHVHTNSPGKVLQFALRLGEIDKLKIDNMRQQNREIHENRKKNEKEYAMVAVATGDGVCNVFKNLAVDALVHGGQTMNPSIDDLKKTIHKVNARNVFVLPNNSNIILAAEQAAQLSSCKVYVLPTKTIPQGVSAAMSFLPERTPDENEHQMLEAASKVISGAVTYSVRDTTYKGKKIKKDDIIGLIENKIASVKPTPHEASVELLRDMLKQNGEPDCFVTIFYGEQVKEEEATAIVDELQGEYPDVEFVVENGGQPVYYYYFAVE